MSEGLNLLLRNYPPVLHDKPGNTYLEYYTGGERHIMRLNAHRKRLSQREFAALVRRLTAQIRADNERLSAMERERIGDMLRTWCAEKTKELRPDTMRSYISFASIFGLKHLERVSSFCRIPSLDSMTQKSPAQSKAGRSVIRSIVRTGRSECRCVQAAVSSPPHHPLSYI